MRSFSSNNALPSTCRFKASIGTAAAQDLSFTVGLVRLSYIAKRKDQPGKVANPPRGQLSSFFFFCPRSLLRIWSRETGWQSHPASPCSSPYYSDCLVLAFRISPDFRGGVYLFIYNCHTPSGHSRVYRVTHMRTDGIHCRESADTGLENLKAVPNGCCLGRSQPP